MIVISDTTPIISLVKIGHLDLLKLLFGEVNIPISVYDEIGASEKYINEFEIVANASYIKKVAVEDIKAVEMLRKSTGLDKGESEAIVLSETIKADFLLMDEVKGRDVAKQKGIRIMGTIGILMVSLEEGHLSKQEILTCIDNLRNNGRHISNVLYEQLMEKIK